MTADNHDAIESIWRELNTQLRQFVRTKVKDNTDVDDILQTVFLRIHQKLDTLAEADKLTPWVYQITRNAIVDFYRKQKPSESFDESVIPPEQTPNEDNNRQAALCVASLIQYLPQDQQRALSLYELQGQPQAAIATLENISISGAKSRIQRGRKQLKTLVQQCCQLEFDRRGNVLEGTVDSNQCLPICGCQQPTL